MLAPSIFGENLFDDFFGGFPFMMTEILEELRKSFMVKMPVI